MISPQKTLLGLKAVIAAFGLFTLLFFLPKTVSAEQVVRDFSAEYQIQPDGTVLVSEFIQYDFGVDQRHGIYRIIPRASKNGPEIAIQVLGVTNEKGIACQYQVSTFGEDVEIRIGDPDELVTGLHQYKIIYRVANVVREFQGYDEFYWNVTGDKWQVPILKSTSSIILPIQFETSSLIAACYTGIAGSTSTCQSQLTLSGSGGGIGAVYAVREALFAGQGYTIALRFPRGAVTPAASSRTKQSDSYSPISAIAYGAAFLMLFGRLVFMILRRGGVRPRPRIPFPIRRKTIIPQYDPPSGLTPLDVGILMDGNLDPADISASIISLAQRGYLKIHCLEKVIPFWPDRKDFEFELLKKPDDLDNLSDRLILQYLFSNDLASGVAQTATFLGKLRTNDPSIREETVSNISPGQKVKLSEVVSSRMEMNFFLGTLKLTEEKRMMDLGYFEMRGILGSLGTDKKKIMLSIAVVVIGWAVLTTAVFLAGNAYSNSFVGPIAFLVLSFCAVALFPKRIFTKVGQETLLHLLGFRWFLEVTEKDRLEFANAPELKPETFEKYLPFAVALGVDDKWAQKFKDFTITPPSWYDGGPSGGSFEAVRFVNTFAMASSQLASASSGYSSGTGGGGFSGGGSGGGGGGSW